MRILLIEDDQFFQKFYSFKLQEAGFEVTVAKDGVEGISSMNSQKPDLILLDLIMPNKDGFGVLEDMSKDPNLKSIPVLVFSTLAQEADVNRAKSMGAVDYVNKSFFDFNNLLGKIQAVLSSKSSSEK